MTRRPLFLGSLILAALTAALWALSYAAHLVGTAEPWSCGLRHGRFKLMYFGETAYDPKAPRIQKFDWVGLWWEHLPNTTLMNPDTGEVKLVRIIQVLIPLWMPLALFSVWPLAVLILRGPLLRRYRRSHGLCTRCGYNLTGNVSLKCPECGSDVASLERAQGDQTLLPAQYGESRPGPASSA